MNEELKVLNSIYESLNCIGTMLFIMLIMYLFGWDKK